MDNSHHHKRKKGRSSHAHRSSSSSTSRLRRQDILAKAYTRLKAGKPVAAGHAEHHEKRPFESVRDVEYNGHHIVIHTQYKIEVDSKPLKGHVYVDNSGRVYTHAMPAYSFASTVELVKNLIDTFPDNFPKVSPRQQVLRQRKA